MPDDDLSTSAAPANDWQQDNSTSDQAIAPTTTYAAAESTSSNSMPTDSVQPAASTDMPDASLSSPSSDSSDMSGSNIGSTSVSANDLLDIKQKALGQLTPIVNHLGQTPEEKFKTTMMMIQASDNQDLIKDAYEAAQQITDEKVKAQALLDVVNEINYFTRQESK